MFTVRRANERGVTSTEWLTSRHTFSFADYWDPKNVSFHDLKVINEDIVAPHSGFGLHPHKDMEIITYILSGSLTHADSTGSRGTISEGEVQRMSAGSGILHSEFNHGDVPVHLLQIWIRPKIRGLPPSYEQKRFERDPDHSDALKLIASPDSAQGSLKIHNDVYVYQTDLDQGDELDIPIRLDRFGWLQLARGRMAVGDSFLEAGDGVAISEESVIKIKSLAPSLAVFFDLP